MKKLLRRNEFYILLVIIVLSVIIQIQSGQFFTNNNIVDIIRSMIVPGIFAIGVLMEIISGGIDVSFPAIALLSMYSTTKLLMIWHYNGSVLLAFVISGAIGMFLGFINAVLISKFDLPTLIVTLGTGSLYTGFMQGVLKSKSISDIPRPMLDFSKVNLFTVYNPKLKVTSGMPVVLLIWITLITIAAFLFYYTMLGRGIIAMGGDRVAAQRAGFNVTRIQFFIYCFMGLISGIAGMTRTIMMANCHPTNLLGIEMTIIAAVVLGGTRISGGVGTITGTILGVALVTVMNNSLILMGIPSYWQKFFTGMLILIGTGISAYQALMDKKKLHGNEELEIEVLQN